MSAGDNVKKCGFKAWKRMYNGTQRHRIGTRMANKQNLHNRFGPLEALLLEDHCIRSIWSKWSIGIQAWTTNLSIDRFLGCNSRMRFHLQTWMNVVRLDLDSPSTFTSAPRDLSTTSCWSLSTFAWQRCRSLSLVFKATFHRTKICWRLFSLAWRELSDFQNRIAVYIRVIRLVYSWSISLSQPRLAVWSWSCVGWMRHSSFPTMFHLFQPLAWALWKTRL